MAIYKTYVEKTIHGVSVTQKDFDYTIDAERLEDAVNAMVSKIEIESIYRLINRQPLPTPTSLEEPEALPEDTSILFITVDIDKAFREANSESVRKNISMPAWLDLQLRYYNVDASRLFQDAAIKYLEEKQRPDKIQTREITTVEELIQYVPKNILDEYVMKKLLQ